MIELIKEAFWQNAVSSFKATLVILFLFVLTKPITKRYTAGFRYYSWFAVMVVFLIPFSELVLVYRINIPSAVADIQMEMLSIETATGENAESNSLSETGANDGQNETYTGTSVSQSPLETHRPAERHIDTAALLPVLWLFGSALYFSLNFFKYVRFRRLLARLSSPVKDGEVLQILTEECAKLKISAPPAVKISHAAGTPMLMGLLKAQIVLPRSDYSAKELRLILRHELFHFKRKDIFYQLITLIFVSLHWFNPAVHTMAKPTARPPATKKPSREKAMTRRYFTDKCL